MTNAARIVAAAERVAKARRRFGAASVAVAVAEQRLDDARKAARGA
ncbi:hypothetical protein NLX62_01265 [Mycobacteriaceae bacterium Msp059]|nr:hypothetical protein [Mycobacteriaceae bacterium Msp059]